LFATFTTASMQRRTHHVAFQSELLDRHQDCINTMWGGHPPSDLERSSFTTILHGYERRLILLKEEVGLDSSAAVEMVANSARQLEETQTLVSSAWASWAARGAAGNREGRAQFYHERFLALFEPAVETFLGSGASSTSGDAFGPSPAGCGPKPDAGAPGRRPSTSLHQTDGGTPARTPSSRPRSSEPSVVPTSPAAGPQPQAAAPAWTPPPPAPSPWLGHWPPAIYNPNLPIGSPPYCPPPAAAHPIGPPPKRPGAHQARARHCGQRQASCDQAGSICVATGYGNRSPRRPASRRRPRGPARGRPRRLLPGQRGVRRQVRLRLPVRAALGSPPPRGRARPSLPQREVQGSRRRPAPHVELPSPVLLRAPDLPWLSPVRGAGPDGMGQWGPHGRHPHALASLRCDPATRQRGAGGAVVRLTGSAG
jgi:hypothetical protein